jgi:hypothetical protein
MKKYRFVLLLYLISSASAVFSQSQATNSKFDGVWVNTQYANALEKSFDKNAIAAITPQYLTFDSTGACIVSIRFEQKFSLGKPIKVRHFGAITQFEYKNGLNISDIKDSRDCIAFSYPKNSVSIIFKKTGRKR